MSKLHHSQPIGILDSGIGGLTIAAALKQALPGEDLIYYGDTAHFPYGEKSLSALQQYTCDISDFLLQRECKLIVVACYTASATAYSALQQHVGDNALLANVIDPTITYIAKHYADQSIGLIGTRQTIHSQCYPQRLAKLNKNIRLHSKATPLLAPLVEEGFANEAFVDDLLHAYLDDPSMQNIQALILGCTHYPLLKSRINHYYQDKVNVIDAASIVSDNIVQQLQSQQLCNPQPQSEEHFYLSDYSENSVNAAKVFFGEDVGFDALFSATPHRRSRSGGNPGA